MAIRASKLKGPARIYGLLLLLYPPGFRHRFDPEMLQAFQSTYAGNVGFAPTCLFGCGPLMI